jgi:protein gp37
MELLGGLQQGVPRLQSRLNMSAQRNCYIKPIMERLWKMNPWRVVLNKPHARYKPLHWKKPRIIFTCSMSDFFHPAVPDKWRNEAWDIMRTANQHQYRILTKRPELVREYDKTGKLIKDRLPPNWDNEWNTTWRHIWLGTTAEMRYLAKPRMDILRKIPCRIRWVSCEPLLDEIPDAKLDPNHEGLDLTDYHLVVDGGETGPGARPCQLDWFRSIRDQCARENVYYVHLQNGRALNNGRKCNCHKLAGYTPGVGCPGRVPGCRLLDGKLHQQFPPP